MDSLQKLKRIRPVVKAKKAIVDRELMTLAGLMRTYEESMRELKKSQESYLRGVRILEEERLDPFRKGQEYLEQSVDYARDLWTSHFRRCQTLDNQLEAQRNVLLKAKRELKEIENLEEKYYQTRKKEIETSEQSFIDEFYTAQKIRNKGRNL